MQNCCGGENAGKPISPMRYRLGRLMGSILYHGYGAIIGLLSLRDPGYARLRVFYRTWTRDEQRRIHRRDGIRVEKPGT